MTRRLNWFLVGCFVRTTLVFVLIQNLCYARMIQSVLKGKNRSCETVTRSEKAANVQNFSISLELLIQPYFKLKKRVGAQDHRGS